MKVWNHFKTITQHKILVMQGCFAIGLYKQGLLHDLSKYAPCEFIMGAKYWQGSRSPNTAEREAKGYSSAWLHHKGRNKHHYEYWMDYSTDDKANPIKPVRMPLLYIFEMFIDRVMACKVYNKEKFTTKDPLTYYLKGNTAQFLHPYTQKVLEKLLYMYAEKGEAYTYAYIRKRVNAYKKTMRKAGI